MAARGTRSLVLDISADVTKLANSSKVARSAMLQMQQTGESVEAAVRQSMSNLMPVESAAAQAREMDKIIRSVQANARAVLAEGNTNTGLQLFDVGAADEQVRSLTANAANLRQWSAAAEAASREGGEFADRQRQISAALLTEAMQLEAQARALDDTASSFRAVHAQMANVAPIDAHGAAVRRNTQMSGEARAGMQQLSFQLNDVAVQYAAGTPPMLIYAQQSGQVIQALSMMTNGTKGLLGFLGGPWGMAITTATIALTPFIAKLIDTGDEVESLADRAEKAMDRVRKSLAQASAFTDAATINVEMKLVAQADQARARKDIERETNAAAAGASFVTTAGTSVSSLSNVRLAQARERLADAQKREQTADSNLEMLRSSADVRDMQNRNQEIYQARPDRPERVRKDNSAQEALQRERAYEDQLAGAEQGVLGALLTRARTEDDRLTLQLQMLENDRAAQQREKARAVVDGELTQVQADILATQESFARKLEEEELHAATRQRQLDQQLALDSQVARESAVALRYQYDIATTLEQRRRIAQEILEQDLDERRLSAQRALQSEDPQQRSIGRYELEAIDREEARGNEQIDREHETPVQRYLRSLREAADDTNTAYSAVAADGLENLEDGLVGLISGTESVGSAFKKMASSIIADLARIAVQKLILNTVSGGFFSLFSEGGIVEAATGGFITGPGTGTSDSIPARLSNGEFVINAASTARFRPLLEAINDNQVPAFADGGLVGSAPRMARLPSLQLLQGGGRRVEYIEQHFHVNAQGAVLAAELKSDLQRVGIAAATGGAQLAQQSMADQQLSALA